MEIYKSVMLADFYTKIRIQNLMATFLTSDGMEEDYEGRGRGVHISRPVIKVPEML